MQVQQVWKCFTEHFTWSGCYLWDPLSLLVQNIGTIHKFVWLPIFWLVCSNAFELVYMKDKHLELVCIYAVLAFHRYLQHIPWHFICNSICYFLKQHNGLVHQITNNCFLILKTFLTIPSICLLNLCSIPSETLMNFLWSS